MTEKKKNMIYGISFYKDKKPLIHEDINLKTGMVKTYDGNEYKSISYDTFRQWKKNTDLSEYILVKKDRNKTFEESYAQFVKDADLLNSMTKGKMNLYKTGCLGKAIVWYFFRQMNKQKIVPEFIDGKEAKWLDYAQRGGLMYAEEGYKGKAYKYDYSSHYIGILSYGRFRMPITAGEFYTYTQEEFQSLEYYNNTYIYRVKLTEPKSKSWRKLVRYNKKGSRFAYWIGKELTFLKQLGFVIEIVEDGEENCLMYKKCLSGKVLFRDTCQLAYSIKQNPTTKHLGKALSVRLWGGLSEGNNITKTFDTSKGWDIGDGSRDKEIIGYEGNKDGTRVSITWRDAKAGYYKYPWARLKPFMQGWGRVKLGELLLPMVDKVKRIHTDGFLLSEEIDASVSVCEMGKGEKMGELKYEGYCPNVYVKNVRTIKGDFDL